MASVQARPVDNEEFRRSSRRRRSAALALEFLEPEERNGERVDVESGITIGRSSECDLSLQDTYLSSRHARVAVDEGDLTIEDLGSTNGTYVNQELVKGRVRLERGDVVQVGGVLLEVVR
jgi:pSer/pThr/pTyr-binding forkhead associated (FHA) protein